VEGSRPQARFGESYARNPSEALELIRNTGLRIQTELIAALRIKDRSKRPGKTALGDDPRFKIKWKTEWRRTMPRSSGALWTK
jgi:hypothetical protein